MRSPVRASSAARFAADVAGDRHHRGVAEQAALAAGRGERRRAAGYGQIAARHQLAARRGGERVDLCHHHLGHLADQGHNLGAQPEQLTRRSQVRSGHVGEVVPRGEHGPVGGQDHPGYVGAGDLAEGAAQLRQHGEGQGVPLGRMVECDGHETGGVRTGRDGEKVVGHRRILTTRLRPAGPQAGAVSRAPSASAGPGRGPEQGLEGVVGLDALPGTEYHALQCPIHQVDRHFGGFGRARRRAPATSRPRRPGGYPGR